MTFVIFFQFSSLIHKFAIQKIDSTFFKTVVVLFLTNIRQFTNNKYPKNYGF